MKPSQSILDDSFRYVPAAATSVAETWRRFGWRPTTDEQRKARRRGEADIAVDSVAAVMPIRRDVTDVRSLRVRRVGANGPRARDIE
jgi:hypothetical protein